MSQETIVIRPCYGCGRATVQKLIRPRGNGRHYLRCYACGRRLNPRLAARRKKRANS